MAANESMFEENVNNTEMYSTTNKIESTWSKMLLQRSSLIRNSSFKANSDLVNFQRMLLVPIEYSEKIIGHFLVANAEQDYTKQEENDLKMISERISHLLYSRLQSIQSESKRKKTESELYQSEKKLNLALEASRIGSWDWDIENDRLVFDNQFASILGYTFQELVEKKVKSWSGFVHPDDIKLGMDTFKELSEKSTLVFEVEQRYRHKTEGWVWINKRGKFTQFNKERKPTRMTGTIIDVTKRKNAEIELQHQKNELKWLIEKQVELIKCITIDDLYECVAKVLNEKIQDSIVLLAVTSKDKNYFLPKLLKVNNDDPHIKRTRVLLNAIMGHKYPIGNETTCLIPNRSISEIFVENLYQSSLITLMNKKKNLRKLKNIIYMMSGIKVKKLIRPIGVQWVSKKFLML
jgi:PAS domain S-box-containing protein